jgi:Na+-driven multidrug efflux pump
MMPLKKRLRWYLLRWRRGDVEKASVETVALNTIMALVVAAVLFLVGDPVIRVWASVTRTLESINSSSKGR